MQHYQSPYPAWNNAPAWQQKQSERGRLRSLSRWFAVATGGFFVLANLLYMVYTILVPSADVRPVQPSAEQQLIEQLSVDMLVTLFSLLLPFGAVYLFTRRRWRAEVLPLGRSTLSGGTTALYLLMGCGLLLLGSEVTSQLTYLFESVTGITFEYSFFDTPQTPFGLFIFFLRSAVLPALIEEFAMRGVVMQPLRRYGDLFALTMSSLVFALMHGNMVQAPFAFVAGFILGYVVMRTGTLWSSVLIHFVNNAFSVTLSLLAERLSEGVFSVVSLGASTALIAIGVVCCLVLWRTGRLKKAAPNRTCLTWRECSRSFLTVPMLLVLAYMIFQTILMITLPDLSAVLT